MLRRYAAGLDEIRAARPDALVVRSVEGDVAGTWRAFVEAIDRS